MNKTIQPNSRIRWYYQLFLANGHLVESSENAEGDILQLGQGEIHPNLEKALLGLPAGEKTRLLILAEEAFGYRDSDAIQELSRDLFKENSTLKEDQIISFILPSGQEIPGHILAIGTDTVRVDFNHPLAGHNINLELEILEIFDQ